MANAISDLALLSSGQVIPAEFWPGHESYFLDNDLHRPWWERETGDVAGEGNENEFTLTPLDLLTWHKEEMFEEQLEYWLKKSEDFEMETLSSVSLKDEDGIYFLPVTPPRNSLTVAVMSTMESRPFTTHFEYQPPLKKNFSNPQFSHSRSRSKKTLIGKNCGFQAIYFAATP